MTAQPRLLFVNLPVADLRAARRFFGALGFAFDPRFTDETAACMVVSGQAYVMLLTRERFAEFTPRPVADTHGATAAIHSVSAGSRADVDALADAALASGGRRANPPLDHGFMYGRSFHDLDGHLWEVMWMDPLAVTPDRMGAEQPSAA